MRFSSFQLIYVGGQAAAIVLGLAAHTSRKTVIVIQRVLYGNAPPDSTLLPTEDDLEQALALSEE